MNLCLQVQHGGLAAQLGKRIMLKARELVCLILGQFPITTSTPVTINIILNEFQLDSGSLIHAERNEKSS